MIPIARLRTAALLSMLVVTPLAAQRGKVTGAFVVRLGADTIAVERYHRKGNRIEGTEAIRTPATTLRHYVATVGPGGRVQSFQYDAHRVAGGAPPTKGMIRFGADTTTVTATINGRDTTMKFAVRNGTPYVNFSYGIMELAMMRVRASKADSSVLDLVMIGNPQTVPATIRRVGRDTLTIAMFEQSSYRARVDKAGRIMGLHGLNTTQKVLVDRVKDVDVAAMAAEWARRDAAGQTIGVLSPLDSAVATVDGAGMSIRYSRPARRGRAIMGTVVPYDQVWRTGANAATMFRTDADLMIGGTLVPAGSYTLWTLPKTNGATLIVNKQIGQWGTEYDMSKDLARIPLTMSKLATPADRFTMMIEPGSAGGVIRYMWDDTQFEVPFTVKR